MKRNDNCVMCFCEHKPPCEIPTSGHRPRAANARNENPKTTYCAQCNTSWPCLTQSELLDDAWMF